MEARGGAGAERGRVTIRFYQELNDFLPEARRGRPFEASFHEGDTVKALVEALGVPHTEVDLVLVDGEPSPFARRLAHGQRLSVYPVFESFELGGLEPASGRLRPVPLRATRFLLDVHLGRLARSLRLLGLDAAWSRDLDDGELARRSAEERRILLTRDRGLLKRRAVTHGYLVRSLRPPEQLREVLRRFDLVDRAGRPASAQVRPFSRCLRCNLPLETLSAAEADEEKKTGRIPPRIGELYDRFRRCPGCRRIYWRGTHWEQLRRRLGDLPGLPPDDLNP